MQGLDNGRGRCARWWIGALIGMVLLGSTAQAGNIDLEGWEQSAPRDEVRPKFSREGADGHGGGPRLILTADDRAGLFGYWSRGVPVKGGAWFRFTAWRRTTGVENPRRSAAVRVMWRDAEGNDAWRDFPVIGPYRPPGAPERSTGEFPQDGVPDASGWTPVTGVYRAPEAATTALIELHADWVRNGRVEWSDVSLEPVAAPESRKVRLATVHYVPTGQVSPEDNCRQFAPLVAEAARQRADLVVLPETLTHPGTGRTYAEVAEPIPGPSTDYFGTLAKQHELHLVVGLLERAEQAVYNVAVLIGPDGAIIGKYRKVCLPRTEVELGVAPGDEYPVFETKLGKIGMMICYDGFFPEVARELANNGAEVIAFPVAGCNPMLAAARACENHVYIVSSSYCDVSLNWMITGVYGHAGEILAQAKTWGSVAVAEVDLAQPTIWGNLGDFRAQLIRHRPATAGEQVTWAVEQAQGARADKEPARNADRAELPPGDRPAAAISLRVPPREPAEAQQAFVVQDGFRMDLLAAEPLTMDPVAMEYDENGRAYVVEMSDYPYTDKSTDQPFKERTTDLPLGRVRILEDDNGDGVFDRSTIFAEDLSWPTGLAFWNGGVYVVATPDLWYLKDTDGDGRADVRRKVLTGFSKFNVQAVMNNLRWSLDHRIYGAGGTNGGKIVGLADASAPPVVLGANDFRIDPRSESFEAITGGARFGLTFDDWGHRFICNIRNPLRQAILDDEHLRRNPLLSLSSNLVDVADAGDTVPVFRISPAEPWRVLNARRLSADPAAASPRSETVAAGFMTSACGATVYRGSAYGPEYYGNVFIGEVAGNLIHRQRLERSGPATFRSVRIDDRCEFVASRDNWFRPVNFTNAPDGTLHVLDMYRETIEHPWSMPDDLKAQLDLESGRDRGRIYRLTPPGFAVPAPPRLGRATTEELVALLGHPHAWWRDTAHRLLFERQDGAAIEPLRALLRSREPDPAAGVPRASLARLGALWSLQGLGAVAETDLLTALEDPAPGVVVHALKLAAPARAKSQGVREKVLAAARLADGEVRLAAALVLASAPSDQDCEVLADILTRSADSWTSTAVQTVPPEFVEPVLRSVIARRPDAENGLIGTIAPLASMVGQRKSDVELRRLLRALAPANRPDVGNAVRREVVLGLSAGLGRSGSVLRAVAEQAEPGSRVWLDELLNESARLAVARDAGPAERRQAIFLLAQGEPEGAKGLLRGLLDSQEPAELQSAAVQGLSRVAGSELPGILLAAWGQMTPTVRGEAMHQLLSRPEWAGELLTALETGRVPVSDVPLARRATLLRGSDAAVRARAVAVFSRDAPAERKGVLAEYQRALVLAGDARRGRAVFQGQCANCHRLSGSGHDVGPALETVRHRSADEVLLHILDPNREVAPASVEYTAILKDGRTTSGMIAAETPSSITLRRAEGVQEQVARADLEELSSSGRSLMPEGLERQITVEQMADLLAALLAR